MTCPHCSSQLEVDSDNEVVVHCKAPEKPKSTTSIEDRLQALTQERETAKARMEEAMRAEQAGSQIREDRFKKLLETAKSEPPTKPIRDIDLD